MPSPYTPAGDPFGIFRVEHTIPAPPQQHYFSLPSIVHLYTKYVAENVPPGPLLEKARATLKSVWDPTFLCWVLSSQFEHISSAPPPPKRQKTTSAGASASGGEDEKAEQVNSAKVEEEASTGEKRKACDSADVETFSEILVRHVFTGMVESSGEVCEVLFFNDDGCKILRHIAEVLLKKSITIDVVQKVFATPLHVQILLPDARWDKIEPRDIKMVSVEYLAKFPDSESKMATFLDSAAKPELCFPTLLARTWLSEHSRVTSPHNATNAASFERRTVFYGGTNIPAIQSFNAAHPRPSRALQPQPYHLRSHVANAQLVLLLFLASPGCVPRDVLRRFGCPQPGSNQAMFTSFDLEGSLCRMSQLGWFKWDTRTGTGRGADIVTSFRNMGKGKQLYSHRFAVGGSAPPGASLGFPISDSTVPQLKLDLFRDTGVRVLPFREAADLFVKDIVRSSGLDVTGSAQLGSKSRGQGFYHQPSAIRDQLDCYFVMQSGHGDFEGVLKEGAGFDLMRLAFETGRFPGAVISTDAMLKMARKGYIVASNKIPTMFDVGYLYHFLLGQNPGSVKLMTLVSLVGLDGVVFHVAGNDAVMTVKVLIEILELARMGFERDGEVWAQGWHVPGSMADRFKRGEL
ncbi:hypothetical protein M427DRAFT_39797 [Gonapodya prolifera JEL478]|uniref:Uncharacterized protein n=1 Tax=Gonapodya prolifera (strain JEL478) TaxID=1344416 RepID=A0A138ZWQ3_GONPJ|nr:hypothetical protein M427DRAFT_39797 [Gonapodya prolifera JEL478]|eukprot:KXS08936.1 hypothetical protein M427DRAFT_39797 [Gonapodya prolifera JEL478]